MSYTSDNQTYVAYFRVSTQKQGRSGLGIEAQEEAVARYVGNRTLLMKFYEVESGKKDDRPELAKALESCKLTRATLLVAKMDRLSRNIYFLEKLQKSGVPFVAADIPNLNEMSLLLIFMVAHMERAACSARTKSALQAAKARGVKLGNPLGAAAFGDKIRQGSVEAVQKKADDFAVSISKIILPMRAEGLNLKQIADRLNTEGYKTSRGGKWQATSVRRVLDRL